MAHRETAFRNGRLSDNEPFEKWAAAGSEDAASRANRAWKRSLAEDQPPPLDDGIREGLQEFVARRKSGMDDAGYQGAGLSGSR